MFDYKPPPSFLGPTFTYTMPTLSRRDLFAMAALEAIIRSGYTSPRQAGDLAVEIAKSMDDALSKQAVEEVAELAEMAALSKEAK